jgi:hypothetical protein
MAKNALIQGMRKAQNYTRTENAALTHESTLNDVLDFYYHAPARRGKDNTVLFSNAYAENPVLALRAAFYLRDVRGKGTGERESFRQVLRWLNKNRPAVFNAVVSLVPEYGRWDDVLEFNDDVLVQNLVVTQLREDVKSDRPSLLAKWLPSANTSSAKTRELAKKWMKALGFSEKGYRQLLSDLRRKINVLERLMSAGDFSVIDYEHVPSKANKLYRKAFSKRDADRYVAYLESVKKGEKKINASTLYPYEIAVQYFKSNGVDIVFGSYDETLELLWKALPNYADTDRNALCVIDTSSSMTWTAISGSIYPVHVALSLGLYCAERNHGAFKDYVIEFNTTPKLHHVRGNTLLERVQSIARMSVGGSTNIQGVFDLLLTTALQNNVPAEDMPSHIFILSDLEFNSACRGKTNHEVIKQKYRAAGYELPTIVYWNIQSRAMQTPVTEDESGTILVSGLSATVFKNAINAKTVTPYDAMLDVLNDDRYDAVAEAVFGVQV